MVCGFGSLARASAQAHSGDMKGDRVEIVVEAGTESRTFEVTATRAGRRVEIVSRRGIVEVAETTRSGRAVRTARFMSSRVIALVEHPVARTVENEEPRRRVRSA